MRTNNLSLDYEYEFRNKILPTLKNPAPLMSICITALTWIERTQEKKCGEWISASHDDIAYSSGLSKRSIGATLDRLKELKIIEYQKGTYSKNSKIRRIMLNKNLKDEILEVNSPKHAMDFVSIMNNREFYYDGKKVTPKWNPKKTGRIYSSKPNVQGQSHKLRAEKIKGGIPKKWKLFHVDIKQAEPTVILHKLNKDNIFSYKFDGSIYSHLANEHNKNASECDIWDRSNAKNQLSKVTYSNKYNCFDIVDKYWGLQNDSIFIKYAKSLDILKNDLFNKGKPNKERGIRRNVKTIGGSTVCANSKEKKQVRRGTVLNWYSQGSVAEIANHVSMKLIDVESSSKDFKFLYQVHDSFYYTASDLNIGLDIKPKILEWIKESFDIRMELELDYL